MSSSNNAQPAVKGQRTKVFAVILLAVILLVVITRRSDEPPAEDVSAEPPQIAASTVPTALPTVPGSSTTLVANAASISANPLPVIELPRLLANNPFVRKNDASQLQLNVDGSPLSNDRPSSNLVHDTVAIPANNAEIPDFPVSAIITGSGRPAAYVAGRLHFVEDAIDDQWKIVEIRPEGIVIQRISNN
jgi:hypothetical protein